jgi:hypothetical protein
MARAGLVIYEHHFHYLVFGSFRVELGRAHKRLQFDWDGRDRWLSCSSATVSSQGDHPAWSKVSGQELSKDQDPFATIEALALEHFAI